MNEHGSFSNSTYDEQTRLAERELSAFIIAVTDRFGAEQARVSTEDWLEEAEMMDIPPRSTARDWRAVTIAASARLASRIDDTHYRQKSLAASSDIKVSPITSSNCAAQFVLAR